MSAVDESVVFEWRGSFTNGEVKMFCGMGMVHAARDGAARVGFRPWNLTLTFLCLWRHI